MDIGLKCQPSSRTACHSPTYLQAIKTDANQIKGAFLKTALNTTSMKAISEWVSPVIKVDRQQHLINTYLTALMTATGIV